MASLIKRPTNYVRSSRQHGGEEEFDDDFFLYDDEDEDEPDYLVVNEALNQLNLHILLYVAAWYTGKSKTVQTSTSFEDNPELEAALRKSGRQWFSFTTKSSATTTLNEITVESLNNSLKNDVTKAKEFMYLNHQKSKIGHKFDAQGQNNREVVPPLHFIINHRNKILSNSIVSITEDELRDFCVKLVWAHPPCLYTRGVFCTSNRYDDDSTQYNVNSLNQLCKLAIKYAKEDQYTKEVRVLHQHRASQREPPKYALLRPIINWLEVVYCKNLLREVKIGDDDSTREKFSPSNRISDNMNDRRVLLEKTRDVHTRRGCVQIADNLFQIPNKGRQEDNESHLFCKSCNIELVAPAQTLFLNHDVIFVLEMLSEILEKNISQDYYKTHLHRKYDENGLRRSLYDVGIQVNILQNDVDEGIDIMISVITAIPGFLKTSLFLREEDRQRIFSCTAMKHIMLDDEDTRCWLIPLLRLDASRAMFYMNHISSYLHPNINGIIDEADLILASAKRNLRIDDEESLNKLEFIAYLSEKRDKFFERFYVNRIDRHVFYAITNMDTEIQEISAGIQSVQWLVDNVFRSSRFPFVLLIMDGIMNVFVQASFQLTLLYALLYIRIEVYVFATITACFSIMYFLVREILQTCSFRTFNEAKAAFTSIWNIVDWFTICLVIAAIYLMHVNIFNRRGEEYTNYLFSDDPKPAIHNVINLTEAVLYNVNSTGYESAREQFNIAPKYIYTIGAFAILLQSLHFIFYLRLLNEDLAVLIFSITEVTKNVKWFMIVLVIIIYVFSQIFVFLQPLEKTSIPCVFEDDLRDNVDSLNVNGDLNSIGLNVTLEQGEVNDMFEYNFEVCSVGVNYRYVYELMYGVWQKDAFDGDTLYMFFVVFTLYVTLVMLNILIAIASASFASANTKGPLIFRVLRIEFVAEAIGIEDLFCYGEAYGDEAKKRRARYDVTVFCVAIAIIGSCIYSCILVFNLAYYEIEWPDDVPDDVLETNMESSNVYTAALTTILCFVASIVTFSVIALSARNEDLTKKRLFFFKLIDCLISVIVKFGRKRIGFIEQDDHMKDEK